MACLAPYETTYIKSNEEQLGIVSKSAVDRRSCITSPFLSPLALIMLDFDYVTN